MASGKLIFFTGKGGVGKTTVSCASALHFASQGKKTILVSSDPAHSTDDVLGLKIASTPTQIHNNLWAMNINGEEAAKSFGDKLNAQMADMTHNVPGFDPAILNDMAAFPGMDEYFAMEQIYQLMIEDDYDIVIFDTAPTGHTLKMLIAPDAIRSFLLRILRMKTKIENIKGFVFRKKSQTGEIVKELEGICDRIEEFKLLLRGDKTSLNLVSIPTEAGYQECSRTIKYLQSLGFIVEHILINHIIPDFGGTVWKDATKNPAVAMLYRQYMVQQPYLSNYHALAELHQTRLVGLTAVPYEPIGISEGLPKFASMVWGVKGMRGS